MGKSLKELYEPKREVAMAIACAAGKNYTHRRAIYMEALHNMGVSTNTDIEGLGGTDWGDNKMKLLRG